MALKFDSIHAINSYFHMVCAEIIVNGEEYTPLQDRDLDPFLGGEDVWVYTDGMGVHGPFETRELCEKGIEEERYA